VARDRADLKARPAAERGQAPRMAKWPLTLIEPDSAVGCHGALPWRARTASGEP
jgi:hypothetical protein